MKRLIACLFTVCVPALAAADPITGSLRMDREGYGTLNIASGGFTFDGGVWAGSGVVNAWLLDPSKSSPGMLIDLGAFWHGASGQSGSGHLFGGIDTDNVAIIRFSGEALAPFEGDEVSISTPFGFSGEFYFAESVVALNGGGTATLALRRFPGNSDIPTYWDLDSLTYDFGTTNPEPATMLLLASGLAVVVRRYGGARRI